MTADNAPRMRSRVLGGLAACPKATLQHYNADCATPGPVTSYLQSSFLVGEKKTTVDYVVKNFYKRQIAGEWFNNPFTSISRVYNVLGSDSLQVKATGPLWCGGVPTTRYDTYVYTGVYFPYLYTLYLGVPGDSELIPGDRKNDVLRETYTRCLAERQQGDSNYIESLAEIDQAWHLFGGPLDGVKEFLRNYDPDKGRSKKATDKAWRLRWVRAVRNGRRGFILVSSEWLKFRYGISPLISDTKTAYKAFVGGYPSFVKNYTSRATATIQDSKTTGSNFVHSFGRFYFNTVQSDTIEYRAYYVDQYESGKLQKMGLTLQNLLAVAWELTPFSFVVDWFVTIGDFIYANMPRVNIYPRGGGIVLRRTLVNIITPTSVVNTGTAWAWTGTPGCSMSLQYKEVSRVVNPEGATAIVIKDNFKLLSNWNRALDASALIAQQLERIRKSYPGLHYNPPFVTKKPKTRKVRQSWPDPAS